MRYLRSLTHPNIVSFVEDFHDAKSGKFCIVMEFADGGDLDEKIKGLKSRRKMISENQVRAAAMPLRAL